MSQSPCAAHREERTASGGSVAAEAGTAMRHGATLPPGTKLALDVIL
eukprot:CAMPEP_0183363332 /NCGR_PEP_ID=MMETSP0164_2-20130417/74643_1 /TAXON_ID=221442 /ORGANISM="Coccolithus pelagicus ssp braarudi, Strain PLY182g" /LENGTH=46 /DNA_ID= /DNA_START= /DNA_END= /DNA_ORIENTATION=